MIAATNINIDSCVKYADDFNKLRDRVKESIPANFRHIEYIINNTMYFVLVSVANSPDYTNEVKRKLQKTVFHNLRLVGILDLFVSVEYLDSTLNKEILDKYREGCC